MKDWYLRQTERDRLIVIALSVLVVLGLLYAVAWYPLQTKLARAESAIENKSETLSFLREGAARLKAAGGQPSEIKTTNKSTFLLIDEIGTKYNLGKPDNSSPTANDGARVNFASVEFDKLVKVLAELETYGVSASTINISRKDEAGIVSVRLTMEKS